MLEPSDFRDLETFYDVKRDFHQIISQNRSLIKADENEELQKEMSDYKSFFDSFDNFDDYWFNIDR